MSARRGFALLAVIWILIGVSVLALLTGTAGRRAVARAEYERDRLAGRWRAEGCIERLRSVLNGAMKSRLGAVGTWRNADRIALQDSVSRFDGCELSMDVDGRVVWSRASEAALDSLPGMSFEAVAKVLRMQSDGIPITDILLVEGQLSPEARAAFDSHFVDLSRLTTIEPDAWIVRSRAHIGSPSAPVNIKVRLVRAGERIAIVRWVEW